MNRTTILISAPLLRDLLQLPENVNVVGEHGGNVLLTLEGEGVPADTPESLAMWMKKDEEVTFLRFEPCNHPCFPKDTADGQGS